MINKSGKTIVTSKQDKRRVFSKEVACILKSILTQPVNGASGTATYCKISGVDVAAKTGTTDENYDRWLCGFTPYYTAVTWYGYDKNETIEYNKRNPAGLLWANVMSRVHAGLKSAKFEIPNTVTSVTICSETGEKATTGCPNTYIEHFLWFTTPGLCHKHSGSQLDSTSVKDTIKNTQNKTEEIVKGITNDIDAEDPQEKYQQNINTNNSNENTSITNTNKTTNTVNNTNITTNNINITNSTNNTSNNSTNTNIVNNSNTNNSVNTSNSTNSDIVNNNTDKVDNNTITNTNKQM